jgi:hypothetical protein
MSCDRIWNKEITNWKQFSTPQEKENKLKQKHATKQNKSFIIVNM